MSERLFFMAVATTSGLTVRYGAKTAIDSLDIEIPEGCVGLLGPNGAGKTTLIKSLLGFVRPTAGAITVLGLDAAAQGMQVRQRIGLMPEVDCHIPGINAVSFVAYAGELAGMPANAALGRAHEVLEFVGLGEARYRNVETYSTGMKQRIKLAQALVHGPHLVFLDEPTNGLDPAGRDEMLQLIRDISHGKGVNVIVSSHLMPDIEYACDYVIVLHGGKVATRGDIDVLRAMDSVQVDVELQIAGEAFVAALKKRGVNTLRQTGHTYRVEIPTAGAKADVGRLLFEAGREAGAQVRGFRPALRSLDDVFIEAAS
jgi:ABC-2 type transport system ATP-binding protein